MKSLPATVIVRETVGSISLIWELTTQVIDPLFFRVPVKTSRVNNFYKVEIFKT